MRSSVILVLERVTAAVVVERSAIRSRSGERKTPSSSLASEDEGVFRSPDLDLIALRSTTTAAVTLSNTRITEERMIHPDAEEWLPLVRPAFLGLQIGMSIGLAWRALSEARNASGTGAGRQILQKPIEDFSEALSEQERVL